jgi:imidazolonepropionase-like amidohydrolase
VNRTIAALCLSVGASLALAGGAAAQNLVINNARIIVGPDRTIENGTLVVADGRIASVTANPAGPAPKGPPAAKGVTVINGTGMTLIAGYMDGHRHIVGARGTPEVVTKWLDEQAPDRMRELLESGVTTVQSGGDDNAGVLELKRRIESGRIKGPRIIASGGVPTARLKDEAEVRAAVDKVIKDGADSVAEVHYPDKVWPYNPSVQETKNLAAGIDEAKKLGVDFQVHAVSDQSMTGAVHIGAKKLIHSVNINFVSAGQAKEVAAAGAEVASITGFGSPNFDVYSKDNKPKFRDGKPWPEGIVDSQGVGQEAGYMPVNLRTLYDNGVNVAYATDTTFDARAGFAHEIKTLALVFSNPDLVKILGPNSAHFLNKEKDNGTLEVGKLADFLVLGGNPYDGFWYFMNPVVVVKGGVIMVDKRGQPDAGKPIVRYGY